MSKIGFSYVPQPYLNPDTESIEEIFRPLIPIRLSVGHGSITRLIDALADSGSDRNLFPLDLGTMLGINFKKIKPTQIRGIGDVEIPAYCSKINLWLNTKKFLVEVDFSPKQQTLLLGRNGFFNLFKSVAFDESRRFVDIETF